MTATRPVALVTGASSGIGKAARARAGRGGFRRGRHGPQHLAGSPPPAGVTFLDLDVTSDESVTAVVEQVIDRFGRIDVLVNNAGIGVSGRRRGELRRPGPERVRHQRLRRHADDQGGPAAHARPGRRTDHQHLLRPRVHPQPVHGRLRRDEARGRGLLRVPGPRGPRARRPGPARRARLTKTSVRRPTAAQPDTPLPVYAERRRIFDEVMAEAIKRRRRPRRRRQGDRRCGHRQEAEAALHRRLDGRDASARCAASFRPGSSTACPQIQPDAELTLTFEQPDTAARHANPSFQRRACRECGDGDRPPGPACACCGRPRTPADGLPGTYGSIAASHCCGRTPSG